MSTGATRGMDAIGRWLSAGGEREHAATLIGAIALAGPLIGFATFVLPHPAGTDFITPTIAFAVSLLAGVLIVWRRASVGWPVIAAAVALGAIVITVTMLSVPDRTGAYATYYVWLGMFAFYFLRPLWALAEVAWIAALYAVAVAIDSPPGAVEQWLNGAATTLGVGLLVLALRTRIGALITRLESAAMTDEMTGLPNRRAFDQQLDRELQRSLREGTEVGLVLVDLDRFKELNDTLGHLGGDRALRTLGPVIRSSVRVMDWPARIGGDEFAVLLPGAGPAEGLAVARRLRAGIEDAFAASEVPLLASLGVASASGRDVAGPELLALADQALYEAKRDGGDRVAAARPDTGGLAAGEAAPA